MNQSRETMWLRWKGFLGSIKKVAIVGVLGGLAGLSWATGELVTAQQNVSEPQPVTLAQIVNEEVERRSYVAVEGYAAYDTGYEERQYGIKTASYYYLFDIDEGYAVLIKSDRVNLKKRVSGPVSLTGITTFPATSPNLFVAVSKDVEHLAQEGFKTTPSVFIKENARPKSGQSAIALVAFFAVISLLSPVLLAFPDVVFVPVPGHPGGVAQQGVIRQGMMVTGRFQKLKQKSSVEFGGRWRKFARATADVIPLENRQVMIHVNYTLRHFSGIKIIDNHWGVIVDATNTLSVEPGKVLSLTIRSAVHIVHMQRQNKPEQLVVSFAQPEDQAHFVALLKHAGLAVDGAG